MRAKRLEPAKSLERFGWSSYGEHLQPASQRPAWLRADRLLGEQGIPKDSAAGRKHFARLMERREAGEQRAQRIVREETRRLGWGEADLQARRKGDKQKVLLARRLRMGSWTYVFNLLHQKTKATGLCK